MRIREAYVAGRFYPANPDDLKQQLNDLLSAETPRINLDLCRHEIIGGIVPHAGFTYSGKHAIHFFEILKHSKQIFDTVVIVNPNHTGYGEHISLDVNQKWETPLGEVEVDVDFQRLLGFPDSPVAHKFEHSGEVILPFLQHFLPPAFKIVPVSMMAQNHANAQKLAEAIYNASAVSGKKVLLIASTDFSHQVSVEEGLSLDDLVVQEILAMNAQEMHNQVIRHSISMCGYGPVMTMIEYTKLLTQNPKIEILSRGHSGEITKDEEVVDYISMLMYEHRVDN